MYIENMKTSVPFLIFLGFSCAQDLTIEEFPAAFEKMVKNLNEVRREVAKQYNIPFMYELIMHEDPYYLENGKWFEIEKDSFLAFPQSIKTKVDQISKNGLISCSGSKRCDQFLSPYRTTISCNLVETHVVCNMYPKEIHFHWWEYMSVGDAGSDCAMQYYNNDGLCALEQSVYNS